MLQHRLLSRDLLERRLPTLRIQVFESVDTIPALAHSFAGLRHMAGWLGQFHQAPLGFMIFCAVVLVLAPFGEGEDAP